MNATGFTITLHHFKTNKSSSAVKIFIPELRGRYCPLHHLRQYLSLRGTKQGPLFINCDNSILLMATFRNHFKKILSFLDMSPKYYKPHSFRIGACTQAILSGYPENKVMAMGRWKSSAYKRYIRIPKLQLPKCPQ